MPNDYNDLKLEVDKIFDKVKESFGYSFKYSIDIINNGPINSYKLNIDELKYFVYFNNNEIIITRKNNLEGNIMRALDYAIENIENVLNKNGESIEDKTEVEGTIKIPKFYFEDPKVKKLVRKVKIINEDNIEFTKIIMD